MATLGDADPKASVLRAQDRVGRYTIMHRIGAGAMGVVYLANDPELDRRVAIKVLHRDTRSETAARRLLREARAMARLVHPNVVTIHDVGTHDGHVFIAMEFVHGSDLRAWMTPTRRWRDVATAMLQAARGLAAAHGAGIVHRDFKPDNVLIGNGGRVCVTDFGLAASGSESAERDAVETDEHHPFAVPARSELDALATNGLVGTPAYIAPEQFEGRSADELSDQFAFCVSLWEALFGERPFAGRSPVEVSVSVLAGEITTPRDDRGVPPRLRRLAARGLARDRGQRWPNMGALADALERLLGRRRTVARWTAAVAIVAATTGAAAYLGVREHRAPCDPAAALEPVWNDDVRRTIHEAIADTDDPTDADLVARVDARAAAWSTEWVAAYQRVCAQRDHWSGALQDRASVCLDTRLEHFRATLVALGRGDASGAGKALDVLDRLPRSEPCADRDSLLADVEPPRDPETATRVAELRKTLADLRARKNAGEYHGLDAELDAAIARAREIGYAPLVAEALLESGRVLGAMGKIGPDVAALEDAYFTATQAQDLRTALAAATELASAVGLRGGRPEDGMEWIRHARALLGALPPDPLTAAEVDWAVADLHEDKNEIAEAKELLEKVLAAYETADMPRMVGAAHAGLGQLSLRAGDLDAAAQQLELARDLLRETLGPVHPDAANPIVGLASVEMRRGHLDRAAELIGEALAVYESAFGPDHPYVLGSLHNLGSIEMKRERYDNARSVLERALQRRERVLGREHPDVASTLGLLGAVYEELGDLPAARAANERALAMFTAAYGPEHPRVADVLTNLGTIAIEEHAPDRAIEVLSRALAIRRTTQGEDHVDCALVLSALAQAHLDREELATARSEAEQALRIYEARLGATHESTVDARAMVAKLATMP